MERTIPSFKVKEVPEDELYERWTEWRRMLEHWLNANDIADEKKLDNLMVFGGLELQKVLYALVSITKKKKPTYSKAIKELNAFFKPKHHAVFTRHKFWSIRREPEESIDNLIMKIRDKANSCDFGSPVGREYAMYDKLVMLMPRRQNIEERDSRLKEKGKDWEDNKRGARKAEIEIGDIVLKRNMINRDKLTTTFDEQRYRVVRRNGPIVMIQNESTGDVYERNVAHVKKVFAENLAVEKESVELGTSDKPIGEQLSDEEPFRGFPESDEEEGTEGLPLSTMNQKKLPERHRRVPARYQ